MTVVLMLIVIFAGAAVLRHLENQGRAARHVSLPRSGGAQAEALPAPSPAPEAVETLALRLPEPHRSRAWRVLCAVADAQAAPETPDARTAYLLAETRQTYLPETLRAYLGLPEGARDRLAAQGQPADTLLAEQLALIEDGVREALRHDHAAADRLLTQGRFLRERFAEGRGGELRLPDRETPV